VDFYQANNLFYNILNPKKRVIYQLSEETIETLKRWELNESDALIKLQRMIHTAPVGERSKIRRAIDELKKKETSKQPDELVRYLGKSIYLNWGRKSIGEGNYLTPDHWYRDGDKDTYTFFYFVGSNEVVVGDSMESHYDILSHDEELAANVLGDYDLDGEDFNKVLYGSEEVVVGRSGEKFDKFVISIWNEHIDKNTLIDMIDTLDNKLDREHELVLIPDRRLP